MEGIIPENRKLETISSKPMQKHQPKRHRRTTPPSNRQSRSDRSSDGESQLLVEEKLSFYDRTVDFVIGLLRHLRRLISTDSIRDRGGFLWRRESEASFSRSFAVLGFGNYGFGDSSDLRADFS